jgi:hypothetical protein
MVILASCAAIFAIALTIRIELVIARGDYEHFNRVDQSRVALALLHRGAFADPYILPTGPTAHYAPAHPYLLSLIYHAFGEGEAGEFAKQAFACTASATIYALMPAVAIAFSLPVQAGAIAGIAGALLPLKFETETKGEWEAPEAALLLILLCLLTLRSWRNGDSSKSNSCLRGACWGLAFYAAPQLLPVFLSFIGLEFLVLRPRPRLASVLSMLAAAALVIAPWTARNYAHFGRLIFMRDALPLALYVSHNDRATVRLADNYPPEPYAIHPATSRQAALELRAAGEGPWFRDIQRKAIAWIASHPARFLHLTAMRFLYFWFAWTGVHWKDALLWIVTALALAGWPRIYRRERFAGILLAAIWASYPVIYYFIEASTRYRYPIDWTFLLASAFLVAGRHLPGTAS